MRWLREWYHKYYLENPVGWLLAKAEVEHRLAAIHAPLPGEVATPEQRYRQVLEASPSQATGLRMFLWADDKQFAVAVRAPWSVPPRPAVMLSDQIYLAAAVLLGMVTLLIFYGLQFPRPMMDVGWVGSMVSCFALLAPMQGAMRAVAAAPQLMLHSSGLYAGLTRLRGKDLVNGALAFTLPRVAQASAIYGLPVVFVIANFAHGTPWAALGVALTQWVYGVALGLLWVVLTLLTGYGAATQGIALSDQWVRVQNYAVLCAAMLTAGAWGAALPLTTNLPPLQTWFAIPAWRWSFAPPLLIPSTLQVAYQPLWGVAPLLSTALLGWGLTRLTIAIVERGLRRHEPTRDAGVEGWE